MIKSCNETIYNTLDLKELVEHNIPFTVLPYELVSLITKYDSEHFTVMYHCLRFANSENHKISIERISTALKIGKQKVGKILNNLIEEGYLQRDAHLKVVVEKALYILYLTHFKRRNSKNVYSKMNALKKTNNKTKKENGLFVNSSKEKKNNYKDTKLEVILNSFRENGIHLNTKLKNLIKENVDEFDSDVFEKIFENIANSRNKINNLFSYLNKTFNTLKKKISKL